MKLFFSWQSDRPEVQSYVRRTLQKICSDLKIEYDEDSRGEDNAEYILDNILRKLDNSQIVVGDLTSVGTNIAGEQIPNPNVSFEIGYAEARVTRKNLILVFCSDYGSHDDLPFDLSKRSMPTFSLQDTDSQKIFESKLKKAITKMLTSSTNIPQGKPLNIYEKTLLYGLHKDNRHSITVGTQNVHLSMHGTAEVYFNKDYDSQELGRYSHAVKSLITKELLFEMPPDMFNRRVYILSYEGEEVAKNILKEETKTPFLKQDK